MNAHGFRLSPRRILLQLALLTAFFANLAHTHGHTNHRFGVLFHNATLAEAMQMAADEHKLVLLYACKPGCLPAMYFEQATLDDWHLVDLLVRETVPLKVSDPQTSDHSRDIDPATLPIILLLDPSGQEQARLPGNLTADALCDQLDDILGDDAAVARARLAAQTGKQPLAARERLAYTLTRRGDLAAATQEFTWLVTVALSEDRNFAAARRDAVIAAFAHLAKEHSPAARALNAWRTTLEEKLSEQDSANLARNLATLNRSLGTEDRTLAVYDRLTSSRRVRHVLFDHVVDQLVATGRHNEVLRIIDPQQAFRQELRLATRRGGSVNPGTINTPTRGTLSFALNRGAVFVTALAAAGRIGEAQHLIDEILDADCGEATRALLRTHISRAEKPELLQHLERAIPTTQTSQPTAVKQRTSSR